MIFEKQKYQQDCVNNILKALEGVNFKENDFSVLHDNLQQLAQQNNYTNFNIVKKNRLDVLMETGTGKTFTYLETIFELNRQFNQTKFMIVLPRTAIKLGVIQNIKLTAEYFFNKYKKHLNYINYPEDGLSTIQQNFISSNELSILITTDSAFSDGNKKKKNIRKKAETLFNFGSTWEGIASKNPIVIIDEPHLLKGKETEKGLNELENSLFIRFGATYPDAKKDEKHQLSNVVYVLDSISAFNQYLVKKIGVSTIFAHSETSGLSISNIEAKKSFDLAYNINEQLYKVKIRIQDDLGAKTKLSDYHGVSVVKINASKIFLSDGSTLEPTKGIYQLNELEIRQMIIRSIELHFEKEQILFEKNIKALALFFIPKIEGFRGNKPLVKNIFEQEYKKIRDKVYQQTSNYDYKNYLDNDYKDGELQVAEGYFSGDRGKNKETKVGNGVNIILNEKEKLLSFDTPLRFIFSVWALQEGWDNPNIFTLCKLSSTDKDTSRRQQVGRGLRIALNQSGKRLTYHYLNENQNKFFDINMLDIVVSGQEQDFIHQIQNEIIGGSFTIVGDTITLDVLKQKKLSDLEATAIYMGLVKHHIISQIGEILSPILDFLTTHRSDFPLIDDNRFNDIQKMFSANHTSNILDKNKGVKKVKVRANQFKKFKELWEVVNKKSKIVYQDICEQSLISLIVKAFNEEPIDVEKIKIIKEIYNTKQNRIECVSEFTTAGEGYFNQQTLHEFITKFAKDENLPLTFVLSLFAKLNIQQFYNNPKKAKILLKTLIKENIHSNILQSVHYEFNQTSIYANELQDKNGQLIQEIAHTKLGKFLSNEIPKDEFLFDKVVYDSDIEKNSILNDPTIINNQTITVFAKLPKISIPTPYKSYSPDFAYLIEKQDGKQLFLVVETKGYKYHSDIADEEQQKIEYAKVFFNALQQEMPEIEIKYRTRINAQSLAEILQEAI